MPYIALLFSKLKFLSHFYIELFFMTKVDIFTVSFLGVSFDKNILKKKLAAST